MIMVWLDLVELEPEKKYTLKFKLSRTHNIRKRKRKKLKISGTDPERKRGRKYRMFIMIFFDMCDNRRGEDDSVSFSFLDSFFCPLWAMA